MITCKWSMACSHFYSMDYHVVAKWQWKVYVRALCELSHGILRSSIQADHYTRHQSSCWTRTGTHTYGTLQAVGHLQRKFTEIMCKRSMSHSHLSPVNTMLSPNTEDHHMANTMELTSHDSSRAVELLDTDMSAMKPRKKLTEIVCKRAMPGSRLSPVDHHVVAKHCHSRGNTGQRHHEPDDEGCFNDTLIVGRCCGGCHWRGKNTYKDQRKHPACTYTIMSSKTYIVTMLPIIKGHNRRCHWLWRSENIYKINFGELCSYVVCQFAIIYRFFKKMTLGRIRFDNTVW